MTAPSLTRTQERGAVITAFVAASAVGGAILAAAGYSDQDRHPIGVTLMAGIPAMIVALAPAFLAVWLGAGAVNVGDPRGRLPLRTGLIAALALLALNVFSLLLTIMAGARP